MAKVMDAAIAHSTLAPVDGTRTVDPLDRPRTPATEYPPYVPVPPT
jgi:hypothetical protein